MSAESADKITQDTPLATPWTYWLSIDHQVKDKYVFNTVDEPLATVHTVGENAMVLEELRLVEIRDRVRALNLFREGITPRWEDPTNASGGVFRVSMQTIEELARNKAGADKEPPVKETLQEVWTKTVCSSF